MSAAADYTRIDLVNLENSQIKVNKEILRKVTVFTAAQDYVCSCLCPLIGSLVQMHTQCLPETYKACLPSLALKSE